jgi:glucosamine-6-phosphate deaminase
MIFAAAPSQNEMLSELINDKNIDWTRITAFHMDEYVGLSNTAPQAFGRFLRDRLFDKVPFGTVNYISSNEEKIEITCRDYEKLLREATIDIVCMGIGENGHIAFNDPPYANFKDSDWVKIVELDNVSRQQQVNDGCFKTIQDVPAKAITLTIPALLSAESLFVVVPGKTKAKAVKRTLHGPIVQDCPASILRNQKNAKLYLDNDSAVLLNS